MPVQSSTTSDTVDENDARSAPNDPAPGEADSTPRAPDAAVSDSDESGAPSEAGDPDQAAKEPPLGPGEKKSDDELAREATVLLFASPEPLSPGRLRALLLRPDSKRVDAVMERLVAEFDASNLPFVVRKIAGGWRFMTDPEFGDVVQRLDKDHKPERITAAALETLAIVAYRQPVTKAEVEAIRGVQAGAILRTLVDRGLARVTGRASLPGSPLQYGTTKEFLERFGLASLKDLPRDGELTES